MSDLLELAKNCTLDTWFQGKTVRLDADLDLSGIDFAAIPTFGGTFMGNGHTISGLSLTSDGSHQELFRYLQPGGQVTNLTVRGTVAPGGSAEQVGGIAGCGGTVRGCAAICLISDASECLGAVAGYADELEDVVQNYYIDTGVGGVDGISYTGHAQSAELSFLQALEGAPTEFTSFRLILRADGRVIQTIPFTFGQRLSRIELPALPEKEGCFGIWPTPEDDTPRSDVILDVEYFPWLTVISSQQADGDRSLALADGQFTSQAVLTVADSAQSAPAGASQKANVWDVTLTGTDLGDDAILSLRLLCPGGGTVRVYRNGRWQTLDAQVNGSYLIVEMHGISETFCIEPVPSVPAALIAAAVLAVLLLLVLVRRLAKKRRSAKTANFSPKDAEQEKEPVEKI